MRVRTGDLTVAARDTVKARNVVLGVDGGKMDVAGTVDASGSNGGKVEIYAKKDLTLKAGGKLLARGTADTVTKGDGKGAGGSVLLSSDSGTVKAEVFQADGVTRLANAALIDVSGDQVGPLMGDPGVVTLRAGRSGVNNAAFNPVTTTGSATAYTVSGVTLTRGVVVAFKPNIQNSGTTPTLNGKTIKKNGGDALAAADLKVGNTYLAVYDGTSFQLVTGTSSGSGAVGTGLNVDTAATAAVTGAGDIRLEAVRTYEKTTLDTKAQLQIAADTQAFYSRNASILAAYKPALDGMTATLAPGVEVRSSSGDLTVSSDWNLDTASNGTLSMAGAGMLTLKAKGNLAINGSLSDGFDAITPLANLVAGKSWGYRLVSGADTAAVNPLATIKSTTSGNMTLANSKLIRTGTGDIGIATGGNMTMGNDSSVIYTAGQAASSVVGFTDPASASYLTNGGDIDIHVQGDITGKIASTPQLVTQWLFRQGGGSTNNKVSWWVRPDLFKEGVAALGGGNVSVSAGGEITNFSVSVPTTARYDGSGNVSLNGGGNVSVSAGSNINSGVYFAGKGNISLAAGGEIKTAPGTYGTTLALQDASAKVSAVKSASIETVFNPTMAPQVISNASSNDSTGLNAYFLTYGQDSAFRLQSLTGNATLGSADVTKITSSNINNTSSALKAALAIHPATVEAFAFSGDVNVGQLTLAPSAVGNLTLLAAGNVGKNGSAAQIAVSDADASLLPSVLKPFNQHDNFNQSVINQFKTDHASTPLHEDDNKPIAIVARDQSIGTDYSLINQPALGLISPKAAYIHAGKDIYLSADIQHLHSDDITVIEAGRDFTMPKDTASHINLGGPGELLVKAGRNVSLGTSQGIVTVANTANANLPGEGASITVLAGLGNAGADTGSYVAGYINPTGNGPSVLQGDAGQLATYRSDTSKAVAAYMRKLTGNSALSEADTMTQYLALDKNRQEVFAYRHFSSELLASGKGFATSGNNNRGDAAIAALFPATRNYKGDLSLYNSQMRTYRDGSIDLLTPGGLINAGVPTSSGNNIGIVTERGGDIRAFAETGFQVEQSKVITQYGSDITVWVNHGDIDAGRGSKTAVSVPGRVVSTDKDGNTTIEVKGAAGGSGIRAETYDLDGPTKPLQAPALGNVALIAPRGILNASEAGIAAGNFLAVATQVLGADNIQVSGTSSGVPAADTGSLAGSLTGVSNAASDSTKSVSNDVSRQAAANAFSTKNFLPSFISVEVIGLGI
ncbi:MAG: hypothetical protein D4R48_05450 [Nitrosomonadales bacterium]|nr:MAG: hypothetical protein D4R48_05450 [Nitrosomonadales bacterium]